MCCIFFKKTKLSVLTRADSVFTRLLGSIFCSLVTAWREDVTVENHLKASSTVRREHFNYLITAQCCLLEDNIAPQPAKNI